jgi:hypothetical protein
LCRVSERLCAELEGLNDKLSEIKPYAEKAIVAQTIGHEKEHNEGISSNVEMSIISIRSGKDYLSPLEEKLPRLGNRAHQARVCNEFGYV